MATNGIEVYVKHPSGRNAQYHIRPEQHISHLAALVSAEEGLPKEHVRLKYQGKTLDGNKTAGQYGVRVETILKAEILVPQSLCLVVDLPPVTDGTSEGTSADEVVISNLQPVSELYQKVAEIVAAPVHRVQLKISGRTLPSSNTALVDAGVSEGTRIQASLKEEKAKRETNSNTDNVEALDDDALQTIMSSFATCGKQVEVAFSFDTTGSMSCFLTQVRTKLRESVTRLLQEIPGIRISLIAHGDYCDCTSTYVLRQVDLTTDVNELVNFANNVPSTCGGDCPECYEWVLRKAQLLDWSEDSAKALVVIGDYYPHPPSYTDQQIYWRDELDILTGMGVKVYGVQAGTNRSAAMFYEELANVSNGCYVKLGHIDVITDMFLAVCYRESNDERLDEFVQEVETAGQMTEEKREMFKQLTEKQPDTEESNSRHKEPQRRTQARSLNEDWWDISNDRGCSDYYVYNAQTDKWSKGSRGNAVGSVINEVASHSAIVPTTRTSTRRGKPRRKCVIM